MKRQIKASVDIPKGPFDFAMRTASIWFSAILRNYKITIVLSRDDIRKVKIRERLITFAGNTPGLADALVAALGPSTKPLLGVSSIEIHVNRCDEAVVPDNNPLHASERVRRLIS